LNILKFSGKNVKNVSQVRLDKILLCYEGFKALFSDFEVLDICGGFFWEKVAKYVESLHAL
jgi:hypothetical protein